MAKLLEEPNIRELVRGYWEELQPLKSTLPLDPDWDEMRRREACGAFAAWTARVDGTLAGFASFDLYCPITSRGTMIAVDAGHYVAPAFRGNARIGWRMWRTAEPALKARGAKLIIAHDNLDRPLMPFFLSLGYAPRTVTFWKAL